MKSTALRSALSTGIVLSALAVWMPRADAILIDFESASGYTTTGGTVVAGGSADGNLLGQPSGGGVTTWSASSANNGADLLRVASNNITGTGQMLLTQAGGTAATFYTFNPSAADLGGTFSKTASQLSFSMNVAYDGTLHGNTTMLRIALGGNGTGGALVQPEVSANGQVDYTDSTGTHFASTAMSNTFVAPTNSFFTISGTLNYATDTYTLSINGVPQKSSLSLFDIPFIAADVNSADETPTFSFRTLNNGSADFVPVAVDNLSLQLVPEPGTIALLGGGVLILLWRSGTARRTRMAAAR